MFRYTFTPEKTTAITSNVHMEGEWWYTEHEQPSQAHPATGPETEESTSSLGFCHVTRVTQEMWQQYAFKTQHLSQIHT